MTAEADIVQDAPFPVIEGVRFAFIPSAEGYAASDDGRIWSRWKVEGNSKKVTRRRYLSSTWKLLKACSDRSGYLRCGVRFNGKLRTSKVHQLVLFAFIGPKPTGFVCCHSDGNPANNSLSNLRWDSQSANQFDKRGRTMTLEIADEIRSKYKHGSFIFGMTCLAKQYGYAVNTIKRIVKNQSYPGSEEASNQIAAKIASKRSCQTACRRGYDHNWRRYSKAFLANNPVCSHCGEQGVAVDHIHPHNGDELLFHDETNWQSLCLSCHSRKTINDRWLEEIVQLVRDHPPDDEYFQTLTLSSSVLLADEHIDALNRAA